MKEEHIEDGVKMHVGMGSEPGERGLKDGVCHWPQC